MEKRGETGEYDIREFIKTASAEGKVIFLNMDNFIKKADGRGREAIVIFATGVNAKMLREALKDIME